MEGIGVEYRLNFMPKIPVNPMVHPLLAILWVLYVFFIAGSPLYLKVMYNIVKIAAAG